jgi:two-component system, NarL family, invasion response regulator UvrY
MKNFLLIDDHEVVRAGVKNVLLDLYNPCTVYETDDEQTVIQQLNAQVFDLVIMDVQMPDIDTIALMEYIKNHFPLVKVLIFSMSAENIYAKRFLKAGAMGFVTKNAGLTELKKAIDLVLNSRRYISENLAEMLVDQIGEKETGNPFQILSARELDIASILIKGTSVSEIAESLHISISTVGTYKARLFKKLEVNNIAELIEKGRVYNM